MTLRTVSAGLQSEGLSKLLSKISKHQEPVLVQVAPKDGAIVNECFYNVKDVVDAEGGQIVFGWSIWECPGSFIEAEQHAVWKPNEGPLLDITPKEDLENEILFVPSRSATFYFGKPNWKDNIRLSTSSDPKMKEALHLVSKIRRIEFKNSEPSGRQRRVEIRGKDLLKYDAYNTQLQQLLFSMRQQ